MSAAFNVAEPEGSAGLDETDDDAADKDSSILLACAGPGAAAIRAGEDGGMRRSEMKTLNCEKVSNAFVLGHVLQ